MIRTVLATSIAATVASVAAANTYNGAGGAIPDNAPAGAIFQINVADAGVVGVFNGVTLNGLNHTWCGDIKITLTLPDSTVISIVDRIGKTSASSGFGDSSDFAGNYTFTDAGGDIWAAAAATTGPVPAGAYRATGALSSTPIDLNALIAGHSVTGTWTLTVSDNAAGDTGSFTDWVLDFSVVPAPGAVALLGLAGLTARRRRA